MRSEDLQRKYIEFFKKKKHRQITNSSLIPKDDPTVLFTTAGMHPLVPYLLGQKHPLGKRLVNIQRCIRTGDIDEVGNIGHLTFFEMLGNWGLGDYFKKEAIEWSFEFLTKVLGFDEKKLFVTCFKGDRDAPKDIESAGIWESLGLPKERIYFLPKKDNWWGPAGETGPCGPCSEMFIDVGGKKCSRECKPGCGCGKYLEIWNDVFMEYNKTKDGKFVKLKQRNVDTGFGFERGAMILQKKKSVYETDVFIDIIGKVRGLSKVENLRSERIVADHLRAACFILMEGITPGNLEHGYVLRRLIRKSLRHLRLLGVNILKMDATVEVAKVIIDINKKRYPLLDEKKKFIFSELKNEEDKFQKTLDKGLKEFEKMIDDDKIDAKEAFLLYQSYGFPIEMIQELAEEKKVKVDVKGFEKEFKKHQEVSRKGSEHKFKSGLHDHGEDVVKLHTATHLLHQALREVLGEEVGQMGSNITKERLRFDFRFSRKVTSEEIKKVEDLVNEQIKKDLKVSCEEMNYKDAVKKGALAFFREKYPEIVKVYSIGDFSKEICAGPHVESIGILGEFKIIKEQSSAAGVRRIKAILV